MNKNRQEIINSAKCDELKHNPIVKQMIELLSASLEFKYGPHSTRSEVMYKARVSPLLSIFNKPDKD